MYNEIWDSRLSNKTEQKYGIILNIRAHLNRYRWPKYLVTLGIFTFTCWENHNRRKKAISS